MVIADNTKQWLIRRCVVLYEVWCGDGQNLTQSHRTYVATNSLREILSVSVRTPHASSSNAERRKEADDVSDVDAFTI
jgi:hypothetical protein